VKKRFPLLLSLALLAGALGHQANAATMSVVTDAQGRYVWPFHFIDNTGPVTGYAGVFQAVFEGSQTFDVLCVDLYTNIDTGQVYQVNVLTPDSLAAQAYSTNIGRAAWLYTTYMPEVNAAADKAVAGAALQMAIWDVIHDGGDGLLAGTIMLDPAQLGAQNVAATTLASSYVAASQGQSLNSATVVMNVAGPSGSQTVLTSADAYGNFELLNSPEPPTFSLFGMGALLIGAAMRRRRP
jgi:hypothetical protein